MATYLPYLYLFIAVVVYASLDVYAKKVVPDFPVFLFMALTTLILSIGAFVFHFILEKNTPLTNLSPSHWLALAGFGLLNLLGFWLYMKGISDAPITTYKLLGLLSPIIVGVLGYYVLSEDINWSNILIGLCFISVGLYFSLR